MKKWIKNLGIILLVIGIFGVFKNINWITLEERIGLIISTIFIITSLIIEFISWKEK